MMDRDGSTMPRHHDVLDDEFVLTLRPEPQYVGTARAFAAALARHFRCDEERVQDVKVAISEACSNAIKAHRSADVGDPVRLVVRRTEEQLWFEIADQGAGFELTSVRDLPLSDDDLFEGGIGLMLIRSLFPQTSIDRNHSGGMTVRFPLPLVEASGVS